MTLLDFMHPHGSQAAIAAEPITDSPAVKTTVDSPPDVPPKIATEIESPKALPAAPAPEDVTTTSVDEPVKDDVSLVFCLSQHLSFG